ncbi:transcriptional regulator [Enterobacter ludwigii]|uniref:transcriptional regulator n=2 Tax=Enterobacter TaxID=547 RepID=UPI003BEF40F9
MNKVTNTTGLETVNGVPMMRSRDIANVVKKDHGKVCRDIRVMLGKLYSITEAESTRNPDLAYLTNHGVTCSQFDNDNPNAWEYWLDYEHSQCLVAGYDASRRMSIIRQWQALKDEVKQLQSPSQPEQQEISMNHDILSLARVVAEATASATMKAVMEVTGITAVTAQSVALPAAPAVEPAVTSDEFVPVHKVSWATGLSDATCRRLITFAALPAKHIEGIRGLCVNREAFIAAAKTLINESTPPQGKRKRWQNPEFGGFVLRKDPRQTFGEEE